MKAQVGKANIFIMTQEDYFRKLALLEPSERSDFKVKCYTSMEPLAPVLRQNIGEKDEFINICKNAYPSIEKDEYFYYLILNS